MSADSATPTTGQYVRANGLNIYYEECGAGEPLILLHGGTVICQVWQPYLPHFAQHYRVIMPDSRGHGHTANPSGEFSYPLMAEDVAALIQELGLRQPVVCGYSDGGQVALELGMRHPQLARALVIAGAYERFTEAQAQAMRALLLTDGPGVVDIQRFRRDWPEFVELYETWHEALGGPDYWETLLTQASHMWWTPLDYAAGDLAQVAAPALVLVGDRDAFVPVEQAVEMYRLLPSAALAVLPNADHLQAYYEHVDEFAGFVVKFIEHYAPSA